MAAAVADGASAAASAAAADSGATPLPAEFAAHRAALLRFARRRIRDADLAEDAVQDALLAALSNRATFQGQSALRTWLIGILNHKIQDIFRREGRYVALGDTGPDGDADDGLDRLAYAHDAAHGAADEPPQRVANARMLEALTSEIEALPSTLRDVFVLQAIESRETADVCRELGITEANCWVRLHRARKRIAGRMRAHVA